MALGLEMRVVLARTVVYGTVGWARKMQTRLWFALLRLVLVEFGLLDATGWSVCKTLKRAHVQDLLSECS